MEFGIVKYIIWRGKYGKLEVKILKIFFIWKRVIFYGIEIIKYGIGNIKYGIGNIKYGIGII